VKSQLAIGDLEAAAQANDLRLCDRGLWSGGFTLIEVVISSLVVAVMLAAALTTLGAVGRDYRMVREFQLGHRLGEDLMAEIQGQAYVDPNDPAAFGPEAGESTTTRVDFDDVGDYEGWSGSPPVLRDGTAVPGAAGWTRSVNVWWADVLAPGADMMADSGLKRIEVVVTSPRGATFTVKALRSVSGMLELLPPVDRTYVTGVAAELQVGPQDTTSVEGVSVGNHAEGP
jgi:prepilin-type N-terminal cleavage/methylation domain-containing protein